jgi:hypothetical protein
MHAERFLLLSREGRWFVSYRGVPIGPFTERKTALRSAILSVQEGAQAEVISEVPDKSQLILWTFERDSLSS